MRRDLDILGELANIGAGNTATALSQLYETRVTMDPPEILELDLAAAVARLDPEEETTSVALVHIDGTVTGWMALVTEDYGRLVERLAVDSVLAADLISETGNIAAGRLAAAIGAFTDATVRAAPPSAGITSRSAIVELVLSLTAGAEPLTVALVTLRVADATVELWFFPDEDGVVGLRTIS